MSKELWRCALLPYLLLRAGVEVVAIATGRLLPNWERTAPLAAPLPDALWLDWQRFDANFYVHIAQYGYSYDSGPDWAFYPLYPLLTHVAAAPFGGGALATLLASLLVSNLAGLVAVGYVFRLVEREWGAQVAHRSTLYLVLWPGALFLSAPYSESLFLALAAATLYYTRRHWWLLASALACLAAATRPPGVLLLLPLAWELAQQQRGRPARETAARALPLSLVPLGLAAFMLHARSRTGNMWASFDSSRDFWHRELTPPWSTLANALRDPVLDPWGYGFLPLELTVALVFIVLTWFVIRKLPGTYGAFALAMVLLPLSSGDLQSLTRYYVVAIPVFVVLAMLIGPDRTRAHRLLVVALGLMQMAFTIGYVMQAPPVA